MFDEIIDFWFQELKPAQWWAKDEALDRLIGERFGEVLEQAARGELWDWRKTPLGRLAEIIVLDQFSRNIHRGSPRAFALDPMALALAQEAVTLGMDEALPPEQRQFLYMPFQHSESRVIHEIAVDLFKRCGLQDNYDFELKHKAIIDRFGRYPHRNAVLGRESSAGEAEFLKQPNSSF